MVHHLVDHLVCHLVHHGRARARELACQDGQPLTDPIQVALGHQRAPGIDQPS